MIALDILTDGFFCSSSRYRIWCDFRSSFACIQDDCHTGSIGTRLSFLFDELFRHGHCHRFVVCRISHRLRQFVVGEKSILPDDGIVHSGITSMIPGKFAYNMVFSLIMCLQNVNDPDKLDKFMSMFFSNTLIASTVIFMLAVGATFPMFLFPHRAFSLTRH